VFGDWCEAQFVAKHLYGDDVVTCPH